MPLERVVVDTTVWSIFLRRRPPDLSPEVRILLRHMRVLVSLGQAILLGMVRMELLSGIASQSTFDLISRNSEAFDDLPPDIDDYVRAAAFANQCRNAGIAASPVDMLICSVAAGRDLEIFTTDKDFALYAKKLPIKLGPKSLRK